jgi:hypothetical protein
MYATPGIFSALEVPIDFTLARGCGLPSLAIQHVREHHASRVQGLAGKPGKHYFRHRGKRLSDNVALVRRIALPLPGHQLQITLDQRILGSMPAPRREISHYWLVNNHTVFWLRLDLQFRLLWFWAHVISASLRNTVRPPR